MMFIIDFQGFHYGNDDFLFKEIVILCAENGSYTHRFIKMPSALESFSTVIRKQMKWVTKHAHGIKWENNDSLKYEQLSEYITENIDSSKVYLKGAQKKKSLKNILTDSEIIDLEEKG